MKDKQILKVKNIYDGINYEFGHDEFMYAYCSEPVNGVVKQLAEFHDCREETTEEVFDDNRLIPKGKLRYIVRVISDQSAPGRHRKKFDRNTAAGVRILNIMEKRHGWALTKMVDVEESRYVKPTGFYSTGAEDIILTAFRKVIMGSKRWSRAPHMISLFLLIFRLASKHHRFAKIETYKDLADACNQKYKFHDLEDVTKTFKYWDIVMSKYANIFANLSRKDNFNQKSYSDNYECEGVYMLCCAESNNKILNSRFKRLVKKAGMDPPKAYPW